MKFLRIALGSLLAATVVSAAGQVDYNDWKVFRVNIGSQRAKFVDLVEKLQLETWKGRPATSGVVDVMVSPAQLAAFEAGTVDIETHVMHENLGLSIAAEAGQSFATRSAKFSTRAPFANTTWWNSYHSIDEHYQWIEDLAAAYPSNAEVISAGQSLEGRDIKGIHIWGSSGPNVKKAVVWHGTVHAREWITTMVVEYAAYQVLTTPSYTDAYDFYIFPIVNPDGFAYSQTTNRLWRKNRQTLTSSTCIGRDINRNWPSHWDQRGGASTSPCAEDYKGAAAGDAPENQRLRAHLDGVAAKQGVQLYMDVHSYSQLFMYPYGYSCTAVVPNSNTYANLTSGAIAAIAAVHGTKFVGGPICNTIYQVSGDSVDYALEEAGATFSMTVELRDTGKYGFVLPVDQILPSSEEMWAGLAYLLKNM